MPSHITRILIWRRQKKVWSRNTVETFLTARGALMEYRRGRLQGSWARPKINWIYRLQAQDILLYCVICNGFGHESIVY